jgi:hypothetical protein
MPGFDGTGPRGQGPMTGRGEGYCALAYPRSGASPYGYAGLQGTPVHAHPVQARPVRAHSVRPGPPPVARLGPAGTFAGRFVRWIRPRTWLGRACSGRGRRFARW